MTVTVSPGLGVTAADLQAFDENWMTAAAQKRDLDWAEGTFTDPSAAAPWDLGSELMGAMVRMYDLTGNPTYLDYLGRLSDVVLRYRDDKRTDQQPPEEPFRGRVMPAWGEQGVNTGDLHWTGLVIAGVYSYPMAAFARIVAESEDLVLQTAYGATAEKFAKATLETVRAYMDELQPWPDGIATFVQPRRCRTLITPTKCEQAYRKAQRDFEAQHPNATEKEKDGYENRLQGLRRNCNNLRLWAGEPVPHNHTHAFMMAVIEAWRAVDTPFYRERVGDDELADWGRASLPLLIKQTHGWYASFAGRLRSDPRGSWMLWNYADNLPASITTRIEDTSHGGFSMRYLGVLHRSIERINGALLDAGHEPIDVSWMRRAAANTFVFKVGAGEDLAHRVDGFLNQGHEEPDKGNRTCNGWLDLAGVDDRVYYKCREIVLRLVEVVEVVEGVEQPPVLEQTYLTVGSHASLLANKPALTRRLVNRSAEFGTPPASGAPTAWLMPSLGVYDIAYRDTSGRLHELWRDAAGISGTSNLTALADAPKADGNPFHYLDTANNVQMLLYRGADAGVHCIYWSAEVRHEELTSSGAPKATGDPVGWFRPADGVHHVVYRADDGHLHVLWWSGPNPAEHDDLTALASAPVADGDPSAYLDPVRGDNMVFYRSPDGHIRSLFWSHGDVQREDLSGFAGTPSAAGDPVAYYTPHDDTHQIVYRGHDGRLHELYAQGIEPVQGRVLTPPGAPMADGDPAAYYRAGTNTKHVVYRSADGRLHELWWVSGSTMPMHHIDLTDFAAAPPAVDQPRAFTVEGASTEHVVYRGADSCIYEVRLRRLRRLTGSVPPPPPPVGPTHM